MGLTSAASTVFFSLSLLLVIISSASEPVNPHPQKFPDFKIRDAQELQQQLGGGCSYTVKIKTSCSSPRYTRDYISIAFGDAYRNEVYVPRLDDPSTGTFERCSTDTFKVQGPCGYGICYLYLRRDGSDGWVPDSVKIYETNYGRSITYYYRTPLPNAVWYGFNNCPRIVAGAAANATDITVAGAAANATEITRNGLVSEN